MFHQQTAQHIGIDIDQRVDQANSFVSAELQNVTIGFGCVKHLASYDLS